MNDRILESLSSSPWVTSYQLCVALGCESERERVRGPLRELTASGVVTSSGKGKGTRYAIAGTDPNFRAEKPSAASSIADAILAALTRGGGKLSEVAQSAGLDVSIVRDAMPQLRESGKVETTGQRAGTRYWLAGKAPSETTSAPKPSAKQAKRLSPLQVHDRLIEIGNSVISRGTAPPPMTEAAEYFEDDGDDTPQPPREIPTVERAVSVELSRLKAGRWYVPMDIARSAANNHGVSQLQANARVYELAREGKLEKRFSMRDLTSKTLEYSGNRMFVRLISEE